jgi:hypothetical protein
MRCDATTRPEDPPVPQRIDAGPALALLGAALLAVSLFLDWFTLAGASVTGWGAFEALDLVLLGLALAAGAVALARIGATGAGDARLLPALGAVALLVVVVQLLDPPLPVARGEVDTGGWLALAGALLMLLGGLLAATAISVVVTVAGRDARRRVPAVDRRGRAAAEDAGGARKDEVPDAAAERSAASSTSLFAAEPGPDDERTEAYDVAELRREPEARRSSPPPS